MKTLLKCPIKHCKLKFILNTNCMNLCTHPLWVMGLRFRVQGDNVNPKPLLTLVNLGIVENPQAFRGEVKFEVEMTQIIA